MFVVFTTSYSADLGSGVTNAAAPDALPETSSHKREPMPCINPLYSYPPDELFSSSCTVKLDTGSPI